jgi:hypothetical protein
MPGAEGSERYVAMLRAGWLQDVMKTPQLLGAFFLAFSAAGAADIALTVEEPAGVVRSNWPVTSGVPLAAGALRDPAAVRLVADDGSAVPLQTDALARWPDGSVRWLLLDFPASLGAKQKRHYTLQTGAPPAVASAGDALRVTEARGQITIETGPLRLELSRTAFAPLGAVWLDRNHDGVFSPAERVTAGGDFFVRDAQGRRFASSAAPAEMVVEEAGPQRACVRISGRHADPNGAFFSYVVRLHAYRGQPFVRCSYTFINDRQDAVMTTIKDLGFDVVIAPAAGAAVPILGGQPPGAARLVQVDEKNIEVDGRATAGRGAGWAAEVGTNAGFAVGVREFWQQWPKSLEVRAGGVAVGLCPEIPAGRYDGHPLGDENKLYYALRRGGHTFKVGLGKTHELWASFFAGPNEAKRLADFFASAEDPLLATCTPAYICATQAAGVFPPADKNKFDGYDAWLDRAFAGHLKRREQVREYGLLNYGDWFGERQVNWGNLEYDLQRGLFLQYLRTGDRRYFLRGAQAARHHIDVDVIHAVNPLLKNPWGLPPRVGEIWLHSLNHTGGYYANVPLPVDRTYQMGHSSNYGHVWISGDLDY